MSHPVVDRLVETYNQQSVGFHTLRPYQVRDVLLVASLYDAYTLSEDGRLAEEIFGDFHNLSLSAPAYITRVPTAAKALDILNERPFDLVITMARVGDLSAQELGVKVKEVRPDTPVFLMTYDTRELGVLEEDPAGLPGIDRIFVWRGDTRLFLAAIKLVEDMLNVEHDTRVGNVRVLILVEDSIPFYSSYLPMLFDEMMREHDRIEVTPDNWRDWIVSFAASEMPIILAAPSFLEYFISIAPGCRYIVDLEAMAKTEGMPPVWS